jgi:protein-S-isoprenylcysteine O-methyltransferase Ste14
VVSLRFRPDISSKRDGMYGLVRNPSCLGLLLSAFGWVLAFRSGVGAVMAASLLVPLICSHPCRRAAPPEKLRIEYDAYCARTRRLVPWV